jgi:membrane protease YdiL (CAAX protease family)
MRQPKELSPGHAFFVYSVLTYAISWGFWLVWARTTFPVLVDTALFVLGASGSFFAALVLVRLEGRGVRAWLGSVLQVRVDARYYALALVLPVVIVVVAATVHVWVFDGRLTPELLPGSGEYPIILLYVLLFGGGQEEPGWRGYVLPRLQEEYSALTAALAIGFVWALWHLPLFFLPGTIQSELTLWLYVPQVVALSVVLTWITNATGGSVLPGALLHAGANTVVNYYPPGGVASAVAPLGFGLLAATAIGISVILVLVYGPDSLAPRSRYVFSASLDR